MNRFAGLLLAATFTLTACGGSDGDGDSVAPGDEAPEITVLEAAFDACQPPFVKQVTKPYVNSLNQSYLEDAKSDAAAAYQLLDDGRTVLANPARDLGIDAALLATVVCTLGKLEAPAVVMQRLQATSMMSGPQSETWDAITFTWSAVSGQTSSSPAISASFELAE